MYERSAIDQKIVQIYAELREKINIQTGYGDDLTKIRCVLLHFKYCDPHGTGVVTFEQFMVFMLRLNFVGINGVVEEIFNRYDPDFSGYADSHDIAYGFFNRSSFPQLSRESLNTMENIRQFWQRRGIYGPMQFCERVRSLPDIDAEGNMYWRTAIDEIALIMDNRMSSDELSALLSHFDLDKTGNFCVSLFIRCFLDGMNFDRKRLVKALFEKLDIQQHGFISESHLRRCYIGGVAAGTSMHGHRIEAKSVDAMLAYMRSHSSISHPDEITWLAFLDYYRAVSMGNDDHAVFEYIVRSSWSLDMDLSSTLSPPTERKGPNDPTRRGLLVKHSSGKEEVIDVVDELGKTRLDNRSLSALVLAKGVDDVANILL